MAQPRLGWLGPAIVLIGAVIAAAGVGFMVYVRPAPGEVIDTFAIDDHRALVVRKEAEGERSFIELRDRDRVMWQALVPRYAGRAGNPGIAWTPTTVSVRVVRDGRAELFAFALHDASKLGGLHLAREHGPIAEDLAGPITLTDHARSFELVSGPDWHQLVAVDLSTGRALWSRELGGAKVRAAGVGSGAVWVDQGSNSRQCFGILTGAESRVDRGTPCS
jgi:outer membrane protein assembly factor BamB